LLNEHFDVPLDRLAIAGYADTAPVDTNDTPEGRAHNRRVDIVILNQQALIGEPSPSKPAPAAAPAPAPKPK
jgi:chemotaxis protein MotB